MASTISQPIFIKPYNATDLLDALDDVLVDTVEEMRDEYEGLVEPWEHPVSFGISIKIAPDLEATVFTNDDVFIMLNEGAGGPYTITATNPSGRLFFQEGYLPSTSPRHMTSYAGGGFGGFVAPASVQHPGYEAREWDDFMQQKYQPILTRRVLGVFANG